MRRAATAAWLLLFDDDDDDDMAASEERGAADEAGERVAALTETLREMSRRIFTINADDRGSNR